MVLIIVQRKDWTSSLEKPAAAVLKGSALATLKDRLTEQMAKTVVILVAVVVVIFCYYHALLWSV